MNRLRLFKSMIKREILRGILLALITVSGTLAMVAVPERPVDKSLAVYDEKISTSEDVSRQGTPPSSGRQSPLAIRTESQGNALTNLVAPETPQPKKPREVDTKAPRRLARLKIAGPEWCGQFVRAVADEKLLEPAATRRMADGRLEYRKVTKEIQQNRNQLLFSKKTGKFLSQAPLICVTPADVPVDVPTDARLVKDYRKTVDNPTPTNAFECIQYFYAMMDRCFGEYKNFSPNRRIAWAAYAMSMLRAFVQTQLYDRIAEQLEGGWKAQNQIFVRVSDESRELIDLYKTLTVFSEDFREMDYTSQMFLAETFRRFYQNCMTKNNITFDMIFDYLRQFPVAQEILACSGTTRAPAGFFEHKHDSHKKEQPVEEQSVVYKDKQGFLTDSIS